MADAASVRDIDSIPKDVVQRCEPEKQDWITPDRRGSLRERTSPLTEAAAETTAAPANSIKPKPALVRGANHDDQHWSKLLPQLTDKERHESITKLQAHFCRVLLLSQQSPLAKVILQS